MAWTSPIRPPRAGALLLGVTLLAALLRFYDLARQSIWIDEAMTIAYAGVFEGMNPGRLLVNLQGPFPSLVLFGWTRLFGHSEFALRSLMAVVGTATIPALYWALRPAVRSGPALLAAFLLAVSPFHIWYSQEVRNYIFLMLLVVLSVGFFLRLPRGGRRTWVLYTAVNVLGLLSNLSYSFLLLTQALLLVLRRRATRPLWFRVGLSWVLTLLLLSPWMVQFWERRVQPSGALQLKSIPQEARVRGAASAPLWGIPYAYAAFSFGYSYGPSLREYHEIQRTGAGPLLRHYLIPLVAAGLIFGAVATLGGVRLFKQGPEARAWLWLALCPVLLTYAVSARNVKVFNPRYAAAALPAYLLILAEGILAPRSRAARLALCGLVLVPTGISLAQAHTDPRYAKEDARGVAGFLRAQTRPGDALFLVGSDLPFRQYYWRLAPRASFDLPMVDAWYWVDQSRAEQVRRFEELVASHRRILVLFLRPREVDPNGEWLTYLHAHHPAANEVQFPGTSLWIFPGGAS
jgi:mannosyltransferase